jgi:hypothetical protein
MFGGEHVGAAQQDGGIEPDRKAGENRVFLPSPVGRLSDETVVPTRSCRAFLAWARSVT